MGAGGGGWGWGGGGLGVGGGGETGANGLDATTKSSWYATCVPCH